jgi:hypothetical protein
MNLRMALALVGAIGLSVSTAQAQQYTFGVMPSAQHYSFGDEMDVQSARLLIVPAALEVKLGSRLTVDAYGAFARGDVDVGDRTHTLQGVVDTRVRASLAATPWAVITVGVNIPTGNATHDASEAIVASALSTELLGFREALWGTGFGFTSGIATAWRMGETGVGFGASYRVAGEFEPVADSAFTYAPGNEARVRLALDRNFGNSKLTFGVTFQNYSADHARGRELFAPGNRFRVDGTYSFRSSNTTTWTLFATDVWRENGDVTLPASGGGFETFRAGQQNLAVVGLAGALRLSARTSLQPSADFRLLTRESGEGEGWMVAAGTDIPLRRSSLELVPKLRASYGQIEGSTSDEKSGFWGGEIGLALRFGSR